MQGTDNDEKNKHNVDSTIGHDINGLVNLGIDNYNRTTDNGGYVDTRNVEFRQGDRQNLCTYG